MRKTFNAALAYTLRFKWYLLITLVFAAGVFYWFNRDNTADAATFYVVNTVDKGEVTSGIETTGEIVAEQKLSLDVYKLSSRIDAVNIQNGGHVEEGDVLVSFDKNDAYVSATNARASVASAELALQEAEASYGDSNTAVASKEREIEDYKQQLEDARVTFYNNDPSVEPHPDHDTDPGMESAVPPTISGTYYGKETGEYYVKIYQNSSSVSGWRYYASMGSDKTEAKDVIFGQPLDLGNNGLKISWSSAPSNSQTWIVPVPNIYSPSYLDAKNTYEKTVSDLNVKIANAEQELEELRRTDTSAYRNLNVEEAEANLADAQQKLSNQYDVIKDRDIVAPFSGTIDGMENVVVGATPTGSQTDPTSLGTLVSDTFLATFTLGASDVAKVKVGDRVKVSITSIETEPTFEAEVLEVSALPTDTGVAQYTVKARLDYDRQTSEIILREGMLADIEIVKEAKQDTLRLPVSAITYRNGQPYVTMVDSLTDEQRQQASRLGVIRVSGTTLPTYEKPVTLGIVGSYYVEVTDGLSENDQVLTASVSEAVTESVVSGGFGPAGGNVRVRTNGPGPGDGGGG